MTDWDPLIEMGIFRNYKKLLENSSLKFTASSQYILTIF
jgi:hypothetical protein